VNRAIVAPLSCASALIVRATIRVRHSNVETGVRSLFSISIWAIFVNISILPDAISRKKMIRILAKQVRENSSKSYSAIDFAFSCH
jgi:hypothetical protein